MNGSSFSKFFGGIFAGVGIFTILVGAIVFVGTEEALPLFICGLIGFIFTCIGGGFIASAVFGKRKNKSICQNGTKYTGKIYGYTDDTSVLVNGQYRVNIKVHYFDKNGIEREAIIPTKFLRGNGNYPIGATIDIYELNNKYSWDEKSVRYERIDGEEELMDNKPLNPDKLNTIGITCQSCGASFTAAKGYVARCPYCGAATNAD